MEAHIAAEITVLERPLDAMYLIHKALRTEADHVEMLVTQLEAGSSLQPFKLAFNSWATALVYHAEQEDKYLMNPLNNSHPLEHPRMEKGGEKKGLAAPASFGPADDGSGLLARVRSAMVAQEEELHQVMVDKVQGVLTVLEADIGATSLIRRTQQHLYLQVVELRIALEDHLETEEALVLPLMRHWMEEGQQLVLARRLLLDEEAQDPRWMIAWITPRLAPGEQALLTDLEKRF